MQFHSIYLQRRQPGVSYRDFQRLWRSHGDFAASVPAFWDHVRRYVHNDTVEDSRGLPGDTGNFDAVGELYYTDYETWLSIRDVMWDVIAPDEKRVFNGPSTAVRGRQLVFSAPTGSVKLFTFARFRGGLEPDDLERRLREHADWTLNSTIVGAQLRGFTATLARRHDPASQMDARPQTKSNMDIAFIHHFADDAAARSALQSADYARIQIAQAELIDFDSRIAVLTHGWVLKADAL